MKMQEVIVRLRELAPEASQNVDLAIVNFCVLRDLLSDLRACVAASSRAAVLDLIDKRMLEMSGYLDDAQDATKKLQILNESYKEKLGPRKAKPKDDPNQQDLPGFEPSPASQAANVSVRIAEGRHG